MNSVFILRPAECNRLKIGEWVDKMHSLHSITCSVICLVRKYIRKHNDDDAKGFPICVYPTKCECEV